MLTWIAALGFATVTVRTADTDITPPDLLPLGGYTARKGAVAEAGGHRLYARGIEIGDVTVVALDMLTVPDGFFQAVSDELSKGQEGRGKALWLVATHTHCAPDSQMLNPQMTFAVPGIAPYSERWFRWYVARTVAAVQAVRTAPVRAVHGLSLRRFRADLNRGRRPGAKPDKTGWVLEGDGRPLLASYPAHATIHDETWNRTDGDWPTVLADRLDAPVIPGAIGDVSPRATGPGPVEKCRNFVESFLRNMSCDVPVPVLSPGASPESEDVRCTLDPPVPHPTFAKSYSVPDALAQVVIGKFAQRSATLRLVKMGKFLLVGIPGEPTAEVGRRIQAVARKAGFPHCLVVSHVDGWIGYVLTPSDYDRGGYEATLSFNGRSTSEKIVECLSSALSPKATVRRGI
ncbi:MAG: hypothetical protein JST30_05485 [Armatimonadetes bacterium]|nr:hypothetical protein [Armatimonadota bacterium]